jgi:hypothetical protein
MLLLARQHGRVIVVVLPVAREYSEAFLDDSSIAAFEREIHEASVIAQEATIVRLDQVPGISNPSYFLDLAHMNSLGRRLATEAFLTEVTHGGPQRMLDATSSASISPGK